MFKPRGLEKEAAKFWDYHAARCIADGSLNPCTYHAFLVLCKTWSLVINLDPLEDPKAGIMKYIGLCKLFSGQGLMFSTFAKQPPKKVADLAEVLAQIKQEVPDDAESSDSSEPQV